MTATNSILPNHKAIALHRDYHPGSSKSLSVGLTKTLAGALGTDPALATWVEQNRYVYDAILNGTSELGRADQTQFMEWWNWSMSQLQSGWDPMAGPQGSGQAQQPIPAGAIAGANGNIVYDQMEATINHVRDARPIDVYSNHVVINSGSMMTRFQAELTIDTRLQPAEQVLKITASDGTVYFVHDYEDAEIILKTPVEDMLANPSRLSNLSWEEFTGNEAENAAEGWTGGETEKVDDNHFVVVGNAGETIDFTPKKKVEKPQFVEVHGEANISLPSDCRADVTTNQAGDTLVTVKNRDNKVIAEYTVKQGFPVNVNHANESYITINGQALKKVKGQDGKEVFEGPAKLSINGMDCGAAGVVDPTPLSASTPAVNPVSPPAPSAKLPQNLQDLLDKTGANFDAFSSALKKNFLAEFISADGNHDGTLTPEELADALNKQKVNFPPNSPSKDLIQFLYDLDPVFKKYADEAGADRSRIKDGSRRLVEVLKALYPGQAGTINYTGDDHTNKDDKKTLEYPELTWNDISFAGIHFNWTKEHHETGNRYAEAGLDFVTF